MGDTARRDLNYRRGRSGRPLARAKAHVYATETHCVICRRRVDKTLPHRNPRTGKINKWSKTIQHMTDLAKGGNPYDVHLAHWWCNVSAGGREGAKITNAKKHRPPRITSSPGWTDDPGIPMALVKPEPQRTCPTCSTAFRPSNATHRYCQPTCRPKAQKPTHPCPICTAHTTRPKYCSTDCQAEGNARRNRDRYRASVGLAVDPTTPTRPHRRKSVEF